MTFTIQVHTTFNGVHCWPDAPEHTAFLRNPHRHCFYVNATITVTHPDRHFEFMDIKNKLDGYIHTAFPPYHNKLRNTKQLNSLSCEMIAASIKGFLVAELETKEISIVVSEDGENSGSV